eukprot:CAMPEP_0183564182 /NCGR_PEP_ID=MMETSP0371-20130417/104509_1 /TAXON_ID=268820 /ORGANISM="Peridinium aciculiferum, Strain PAER-2" /LENGTH=30 /DNA_ID= /DNA_START= /DNA_END= /DNA_ORIENTATION=
MTLRRQQEGRRLRPADAVLHQEGVARTLAK